MNAPKPTATEAATPPPSNLSVSTESIVVTVEPVANLGANVFSVEVKIENHERGGSIVRTTPREFALFDTE